MNEKTQHTIRIGVETAYLADQSSPESGRYAFAYTITIRNEGESPAKLLNRHWTITDANGKVQEVRGEGVVGEQPYLRPGEGFQYTSGTLLDTPVGSMEGEYEMVDDQDHTFPCPVCAKYIFIGVNYCIHCEVQLIWLEGIPYKNTEYPSLSDQIPRRITDVLKCPLCGDMVREKWKACPNCGKSLHEIA